MSSGIAPDQGRGVARKNHDVVWHHESVSRGQRELQNKHYSVVLWFTGLSGAGKSTLAHAVAERLHQMGCHTYVLDGDNVRHGLCGDLGFSASDRAENIRRVGEVAKLMVDAGLIVLAAFISPDKGARDRVRGIMAPGDFLEVFCQCPLDVCESRDVKGLYKRARAGVVKEFTGISSPYEAPDSPELVLDTSTLALDECVAQIVALLRERKVFYGKHPVGVAP